MQGPDTDPETVDRIRAAIDNEESITQIIRNYRKNGTPFCNRLTISPITDKAERLTNYVGFQEDVTAQISDEQDIKQFNTYTDGNLSVSYLSQ